MNFSSCYHWYELDKQAGTASGNRVSRDYATSRQVSSKSLEQCKLIIEQSYVLNSAPETVFQALTDPKRLVKWWVAKAHVDPREGGDFDFEWLNGFRLSGKIMRFERDKAVSFSWSHDTTAALQMLEEGRGTLLKLHHGDFKDCGHFGLASSKWGYHLMNLKSVLDHGIDLRSKDDD